MEQLRVIETTIKPPFNFFVVIQGHTNSYYETKSLSKAKRVGEELLLKEGKYSFIHSVYYSDDENRQGWLSERILRIEDDCSWAKDFSNFVIHPAFLWNYDVRKWNPKLYDKIRVAYVSGKLKYEDSWEYTKQYLELDELNKKNEKILFNKEVEKACKKVEKKINDFISANDELTKLVQKKYPNVRAEYAIFDRMIMFYLEDEIKGDKEFYSLDELEKYFEKEIKEK